jgi:hypothetical protein
MLLASLALILGGFDQAQPPQPGPDAQAEPARAQEAARERTGPLFIDDSHEPSLLISWVKKDGTRVEFTRSMPWGTKNDREDLGQGVLAFVAVGGTRIDMQEGHPLGSVVRVGFYRTDPTKPFFADIQPGSMVQVGLEGVRFLEDARVMPGTTLHHLQYNLDDVLDCGLDASAIDQYNTASANETLGGQVTKENGRPGVLRVVEGELPADAPRYYRQGGDPAGDENPQPAERFATVRFTKNEETGAIDMRAEIPYELFRHVRDPWLRTEPGTFFEPTHFHVEFECLPERAFPDPQRATDAGDGKTEDQPEIAGP